MKKLIILLAVVALSAGTAQAWGGWDLISDDFGSNQDGSASANGWYVHPFTIETEDADYASYELATGSAHSDLMIPSSVEIPSTSYTAQWRMRVTSFYALVLTTEGNTTNPTSNAELEWGDADYNVRVKDLQSGNNKDFTPDDSWAMDAWHVYTYIVETGATDQWRLWIDDPTHVGCCRCDCHGYQG